MTKKWNLQDIKPPQPRKSRAPRLIPGVSQDTPQPQQEMAREEIPNIVIGDGSKKSGHRLLISIVLFVLIVGGAVLLSAILGKTELTIYPEFREPNVSAEFVAYPDKRENSLSYEIMTLETAGESQVKASGQIQIEELATGIIEIIKTTPGAERLIKNTRFRDSEGKVFRIQESVVVPGAVKTAEGTMMPGTIQAEAFADEVGETYNLPADTKFDIPGFEEGGFTALFNSISARNPDAFTGGYSGPQFQIDEQELQTARQALQIELRDNLLMRIESEKPANFIAFPNAVAITYNELPAVEYGDDLVTIKEQAVLQIPLFNSVEFGSFLAKATVATYEGNPVRVDDPSLIKFDYSSPTTSSSIIANEPSLQFRLTGKPLLIWEYNGETLTKDLAGLPKTSINNAIPSYPGIKSARVHITPFWQRTFPEKAEDIILIEELETEQ
jgi:hypothetical protein